MSITLAKTAGFCFGVNHAVKLAFDVAERNRGKKNVYTLGPLIHNENVVEKLKEAGIRVMEKPEEACEGDVVIIRAHGTTPEVLRTLEERGAEVHDATCPFVKKIHNAVKKDHEAGRKIIIIGDGNHPEVRGISGWCRGDAIILDTPEEVFSKIPRNGVYSCVVQTTFHEKNYEKIKKNLQETLDEIIFYDSICNATSLRQEEARKLAKNSDFMVVIGSRASSNTLKLYEICSELCPKVVLAEKPEDVKDCNSYFFEIGVTAGASTPDWLIKEVLFVMDEVNSIENGVVVTDEAKGAEAQNESFGDLLENSLVTVTSGSVVEKPIIKIDATRVYLDLGFKYEGYVDINEFNGTPEIGDMVKAYVVHVSDRDCEVKLSKSKVDKNRDLLALEEAYNNKTPVKLTISRATERGVIADYGTAQVYIPASQLELYFVKNLADKVGKEVEVYITRCGLDEKGRTKINGSAKALLLEKKQAADDAFWSSVEVDKVYNGKVKAVEAYGAFVELAPGYEGLLPRQEASWKRFKDLKEVVKKGQEIEVKVLSFDREKNRISLTAKKPEDNPWYDAENVYQVGDILDVTVSKYAVTKEGKQYGVFVEVTPEITALVHISHISRKHIESAAECLQIGQVVQAKILAVDVENKKLSLGIKEVQPYDPAPKADELDEEGNPIVREKKERAPRKERAPKPENADKAVEKSDKFEKKPRAPKKPKEEEFHDDITPSGTSIGELLKGQFSFDDTDAE